MKSFRCRLLFTVSMLASLCAAGFAADPNAPINLGDYKPPLRVACIGDSITEGVGADGGWAWPNQLDRMLDERWDVRNFGKSYSQALRSARRPYWGWPEFKKSRAFCADVVVIVLGTNDAAAVKEGAKDEFAKDYRALVLEYQKLPSKPRIFCCLPPWAAKREESYKDVIDIIRRIAKDLNCGVLDLYAPLEGKKEMLPDGLHPNNAGATVIAKTVYKTLTGQQWSGQIPGPREVTKNKPPVVVKENPGELGYREAFGVIMAACQLTEGQREKLREKYEATAFELDAKIAELEAQTEQAEHLRMQHKRSDPELYGKYKGIAKALPEAIQKLKRNALNELIALVPEDQKAPWGAAWLHKYILDRLAPIYSTLTAEQKKKIRELCVKEGPAYGKINNTPERSVAGIEAYKVVYEQILTSEQQRRVERK
jgi:lysophospholipase L1-like esterase